MKYKKLLALCLTASLCLSGCGGDEPSEDDVVVQPVEEGESAVLEDMDVIYEKTDDKGIPYVNPTKYGIDENWDEYFIYGDKKVSEDNTYEWLTEIHSIDNTVKEDSYFLETETGDMAGHLAGDFSSYSFNSTRWRKSTLNNGVVNCGDFITEVKDILGDPYYDGIKDSKTLVYHSGGSEVTLQFSEDGNVLRLSGIFMSDGSH